MIKLSQKNAHIQCSHWPDPQILVSLTVLWKTDQKQKGISLYTREQASKLKQRFWTTFGQYMAVIPSADGLKINWINYKTGFRHLFFKMDVDKRQAWIGIELSHPDPDIQQLYFEQFLELKSVLHDQLGEEWEWNLHLSDEDHKISSNIMTRLPHVSIFNQEDWPALISFYKPRIIALDEFWSTAKYVFEPLR